MDIAAPLLQHNTQVFLGDLPVTVTEIDLFPVLSSYGAILSIKLIRRAVTCHASISFKTRDEAKLAIAELNGAQVKGRYIRAMPFSSERRNDEANLFVKNFPLSTSTKEFIEFFERVGPVFSGKISYNEKGVSRGYGFVQYETVSAAKEALDQLNNKDFQGSPLQLESFIPPSSRENSITNRNLYVRGFTEHTDLRETFSLYGIVLSCTKIKNSTADGTERWFGHVCYETSLGAASALQHLHNKEENGVLWYVALHQNKAERILKLKREYLQKVLSWKQRNLLVKGIPEFFNEEGLRSIFREWGDIESVKLLQRESIQISDNEITRRTVSAGVAFVCYKDPGSALRCLHKVKSIRINDKVVFAALWKPKTELVRAKRMHCDLRPLGPWVYPVLGHKQNEPVTPGFEAADEAHKRRILGEKLFPRVLLLRGHVHAGKITGMLLEMPVTLLLTLVNDQAKLENKVGEAVEILREAYKNDPEALADLHM